VQTDKLRLYDDDNDGDDYCIRNGKLLLEGRPSLLEALQLDQAPMHAFVLRNRMCVFEKHYSASRRKCVLLPAAAFPISGGFELLERPGFSHTQERVDPTTLHMHEELPARFDTLLLTVN